MIAGYIFSSFFGMVSFSNVAQAGVFQLPEVMHFGIEFEPSACVALGLLFVINSVQAIGDFSATTAGGLDREPTTELQKRLFPSIRLPECRYRSYHKGRKPRDSGAFCTDHPVKIPFNYDSLCGFRRRYRICVRIHRHDRHEACYDGKYELPQYLHRRSCSRSGNGCFTGLCLLASFPASTLTSLFAFPDLFSKSLQLSFLPNVSFQRQGGREIN